MTSVRFWFDPSCYWSWRAARWLMDAAAQRDLSVDWRSFSLTVLYGDDMNPEWRSMLETSHRALRIVEALRQKDRSSDAAGFYTALGTAVHENGQPMTEATVREAAETSGTADVIDAFDDASWDEHIQASFEEAMASAGPDIGSPVLELAGAARGIYGPVFTEVPPQTEAGELWDAIARLVSTPSFLELKRGRP
ncbi:DsbA family protein [Nonomuraea sp. NPDC050786]|uniref:DsbA family protein n=1 Tax=Nonomuraea sp. NPDC050786 TaxID=3154840 RepID=UPI0033EBD00F